MKCWHRYEDKYWEWAQWRKEFNKLKVERAFFRKNGANTRRMYAEKVVERFPYISLRDLHSQIGGCREIVESFNLTKYVDEPFWDTDNLSCRIYMRLKENPDEIYEAIENIYKWSFDIGRTSEVEKRLPLVIQFIAEECV